MMSCPSCSLCSCAQLISFLLPHVHSDARYLLPSTPLYDLPAPSFTRGYQSPARAHLSLLTCPVPFVPLFPCHCCSVRHPQPYPLALHPIFSSPYSPLHALYCCSMQILMVLHFLLCFPYQNSSDQNVMYYVQAQTQNAYSSLPERNTRALDNYCFFHACNILQSLLLLSIKIFVIGNWPSWTM